jgi:NAD(P)-dependent dehydrogenase (short-subunit alcohol dehydrogenase family)
VASARLSRAESLQERVAVVTGANRGIGKAVAARFLRAGASVVMAVRRKAAGDEALREIDRQLPAGDRGSVAAIECDVADDASVERFGRALARLHPAGVHVLVNNAAILEDEGETSLSIPIDVFRRHLDVNVIGALRVSRQVVPLMRRAGWGRIVNLSSGMGQFEGGLGGGYTGYRVSKAALNALTRTMAADLEGSPILVNVVDPGWVKTRMGGRSAPRTPESAADAVLFLATLPSGAPSGFFWRGKTRIPW